MLGGEIAIGCLSASGGGIFVNLIFMAWQKRTPGHALFAEVLDSDNVPCRLWTYITAMCCQGLLYPLVILWAWLQWRGGAARSSWEWTPGGLFAEEVHFGLRVYLYIFFGYLARDLMMQFLEAELRLLMVLHHVVCMGGILLGLTTSQGGVAMALGTFVLELGSFFYNGWICDATMRGALGDNSLWSLWPWGGGYIALFSATNLLAFYFLAVAAVENLAAGQLFHAVIFTCTGLPLIALRQQECNRAWRGDITQSPPAKRAHES